MTQKLEPILNLALETPLEERKRTLDLNVGYDEQEKQWEAIVKYQGSLEALKLQGIGVEELIAGYGILKVPETKMKDLERMPQIEYVEKPKSFSFAQISPVEDPCISTVLATPPYLSGAGVLVAILDSGVDVRRREFRREDGGTRIRGYLELGDEGWKEYTREQIDAGLQGEGELPRNFGTAHGTAVAGIAGGYVNGKNASLGRTYRGVAYGCDFLVVGLGTGNTEYAQTTDIMRGVTYALQKAEEWQQPLVVNLSYGNSYGSHRGNALLERFLNNASEIGKTVICVGMGNEGIGFGHFENVTRDEFQADFFVAEYERNLSLQIWRAFTGEGQFVLYSPDGGSIVLSKKISGGAYQAVLGETRVFIYYGEPAPYTVAQEIYIEFLAENAYLSPGVWSIQGSGICDLYLNGQGVRAKKTRFFYPSSEGTITIPATAERVLSVGAYQPRTGAYAEFSGRGFIGQGKPDLVAPGVDVLAPWGEEGYRGVTGTSFATPIVSGAVALLMEKGIINGEDPYFYGEKVKAYLRAGARQIRGGSEYPNEKTGWGALCLSDTTRKM